MSVRSTQPRREGSGARATAPAPAAAAAASLRHPLTLSLLALAFTTGLIDAASYLGLGHVFTANMTGNVVLLGFGIAGAAGLPVVSPSSRSRRSSSARSQAGCSRRASPTAITCISALPS